MTEHEIETLEGELIHKKERLIKLLTDWDPKVGSAPTEAGDLVRELLHGSVTIADARDENSERSAADGGA